MAQIIAAVMKRCKSCWSISNNVTYPIRKRTPLSLPAKATWSVTSEWVTLLTGWFGRFWEGNAPSLPTHHPIQTRANKLLSLQTALKTERDRKKYQMFTRTISRHSPPNIKFYVYVCCNIQCKKKEYRRESQRRTAKGTKIKDLAVDGDQSGIERECK